MNPPILEYTSPLRAEQPAEMRTQCEQRDDAIVIVDPAKGVHAILGTLGGLAIIGVLLQYTLVLRMISLGIRDPGFLAGTVICLGLVYLGWKQVQHARLSRCIRLNHQSLTVDAGTFSRQWPVEQIVQIQAHVRGSGLDLKTVGDLRLIPRSGRVETLLHELPEAELKWLAVTLRQFLSLPIDGTRL